MAAVSACGSNLPGIDPPAAQIRFPIGLRVIPRSDDRYLLVVNSNFDLRYNGATLVVVDTFTGDIDGRHTVRMNSFAAQLEIRSDGRRAFVASRNPVAPPLERPEFTPVPPGPHLNVIDVDVSAPRMLKCTDDPVVEGVIPRCSGKWVTPIDVNPFGLLLREPGTVRVGCGSATVRRDESLLVTHINTSSLGVAQNGIVSLIAPGTAPDGLPYRVLTRLNISPGANGIAEHPVSRTVYVTTRGVGTAPQTPIQLLRASGTRLEPIDSIIVRNARGGMDSRGIAFDPTGRRVYIAHRSTPSVLVYDVSCGSEGRETNRLIQMIDVGLDPAAVAYLPRSDGDDRVYVTCFGAQQVYVIDPLLGRVETIIEVGDGPYDIAFSEGARTGQGLQRAYVADFREDAVSVIELDRSSPNYHREIARYRLNSRLLP